MKISHKVYKIQTIEEYYLRFNSELNIISGYLDDNTIRDILIKCRMKPYGLRARDGVRKILRRHWIDEFGNSLYLDKKTIRIVPNDLSILERNIIHTDLYEGLTIDKILKISKMAYFFLGSEDNNYIKIISLLGIDNYIRTYIKHEEKWERISSILLGVDVVRVIVDNESIGSWKKINTGDNRIIPCTNIEEWLVCTPIPTQFWDESLTMREHFKEEIR